MSSPYRVGVPALYRLPAYSRTALASFVLTAGEPFPYHRDGEPEPPVTRLEVRVEPKLLPLLVARSVADDPRGPFAQE